MDGPVMAAGPALALSSKVTCHCRIALSSCKAQMHEYLLLANIRGTGVRAFADQPNAAATAR